VKSPFGVDHTVSKTFLGPKGWKPVTQLSSLERKTAAKAKWHKRDPLSDAPKDGRKIPTKGYIKGVGRVRVGPQHGKKHFLVYDRSDQRRIVHRRNLGFRK
jgi:hypothetical protein